MSVKTILFVAPSQAVTALFAKLTEAGLRAGIADTLAGAAAFVEKSRPMLVFSQAKIGGYTAESLLERAAAEEGWPPVVVFTDRGSASEAQRFLVLGAKDYWLEPLSWEKIETVLPRETPPPAAEAAPPEPEAPAPPPVSPKPAAAAEAPGVTGRGFAIIGAHPAVRRVLGLAKQVARSKATVLISGESGTGKEMFAKFLHAHGDRADNAFVALNCAALPEHLLESELFGHEKGAFTGAIAKKLGKFELASGGTILLDEISEMDLGLQAKLLRVLQEGEFDRVGGTETVRVDVRVLATTNRRLEETVEEGGFRQDLYYRLNVIPLKLPPLRERGGDILLLAEFFVSRFCRDYGLGALAFSKEAKDWLMAHDWPGNVRELQNLMERAVLLAGSGPIEIIHFLIDGDNLPDFDDMEAESAPAGASASGAPAAAGAEAQAVRVDKDGHVLPLVELEKQAIMHSLGQTSGNRTQAAQLLGISVRTLRNKLNEYRKQGMDIP